MRSIRPSTMVALAVVALLPLALHLAVAAAAPPVGLPGCQTQCGEMRVPYPFGIGSNCSFPGFNLTCDSKHKHPKLFLGDGSTGIQVTKISLRKATVHVIVGAIVNLTTNSESIQRMRKAYYWSTPGGGGGDDDSPFVLSYHQNKFIAMGCNIQAKLLAQKGTQLITGCSSFCTVDGQNLAIWEPTDAKGEHCGRCSGNGCCQSKIPLYSTSYSVQLNTTLDQDGDHHVDPVMQNLLVFIGEQGWIEKVWCWMVANAPKPFNKTTGLQQRPPNLSKVPLVLDWLMNYTLPAHPGKAADTSSRCPTHTARDVCRSEHSSCIDMNTPFRSGYGCWCDKGYKGNPYLTDGCQDIDECAHPDHYHCYGECINMPGTYICRCPRGSHGNSSVMNGCVKSSEGRIIGLGVGSGATLLVLALSAAVVIRKVKERRKQKLRQRFFKQNRGQLLQQLVSQMADIAERMIISLDELEKATNNFDKSRELGGGGHGTVYKGILSSQHVVAIKKSKIVIQKEINEFINEVAILSQVNHRNIVKLHGCCLETEVPLLVYEFISNGTLYDHLHVEALVSLSWKDRLRIIVELARALTYLHSFVSMPIIHRDIKSPNILLDDNLTVKLSDFGASRYIPINKEEIHTTVQGTVGYLDPMYNNTGHLTEKSDVYSFGVLLIELLTRKKPVSYRSSEGFGLANHFVSLLLEGSIDQILDPQVNKEGDGEVIDICLLAAMCVKFKAEDRPSMRQVEMTLESIQASKEFSSDVTDDDRFSEGTYHEGRSWE